MGMDRDRIARWIHDSSNAVEAKPQESHEPTARSEVSRRSKARNKDSSRASDSNADKVKNPLEILAAQGKLAFEAGFNGLTHKTEAALGIVSDGWPSLLPSCGQCVPTSTTKVDTSRPERVKAAMLFSEYEKSKRSR